MNRIFVALLLLAQTIPLMADTNGAVRQLLQLQNPPPGVVFEIAETDPSFLEWAIPEVKKHSDVLRNKFRDLPIAVVTHGREQFALLRKQQATNARLHTKVRSLVQDDKIDLHVCGTHAGWYDIAPEAFADFVNVAVAAPAQINDYRALGYELIRIRKE